MDKYVIKMMSSIFAVLILTSIILSILYKKEQIEIHAPKICFQGKSIYAYHNGMLMFLRTDIGEQVPCDK